MDHNKQGSKRGQNSSSTAKATTHSHQAPSISEEKLEEYLNSEFDKIHPGSSQQQQDLKIYSVKAAMDRFKAKHAQYSKKELTEVKAILKAFMENKYQEKFEESKEHMRGAKKIQEISDGMDTKSKRAAFEKLKNLPPRQKAVVKEPTEDQDSNKQNGEEEQEDTKEEVVKPHKDEDHHFVSKAKGIPGLHVGEYKSEHDHFGDIYD